MDPGQADRVRDTLRAHGIREGVHDPLMTLGADLRERSRRTRKERAAMVSARTGRRLGKVLGGDSSRVDIAEHIAALVPDHPYVQMHTHPASPSAAFSERDAFNVVGVPGIEAMVVVGADDAWYFLSRLAAFAVPGTEREQQARLRRVHEDFWNEIDRRKPVYDALVGGGVLDGGEASHRLTHEVWQSIAEGLNLRYDRVDAPKGT